MEGRRRGALPAMTSVLVAIFATFLIGLPIARSVDPRGDGLIIAGTSFLYGSGATFLVLLLLSGLGVTWSPAAVGAACAILFAIAVVLARRAASSGARTATPGFWARRPHARNTHGICALRHARAALGDRLLGDLGNQGPGVPRGGRDRLAFPREPLECLPALRLSAAAALRTFDFASLVQAGGTIAGSAWLRRVGRIARRSSFARSRRASRLRLRVAHHFRPSRPRALTRFVGLAEGRWSHSGRPLRCSSCARRLRDETSPPHGATAPCCWASPPIARTRAGLLAAATLAVAIAGHDRDGPRE